MSSVDIRRNLTRKIGVMSALTISRQNQLPSAGSGNRDRVVWTLDRFNTPKKHEGRVRLNEGNTLVFGDINAIENSLPLTTIVTVLRALTI
jgi:hypothetical protein